MSRTSSLLLAGAVLAAALAPAAVAGAAPQGKADKAKAEHERIVAYWTPERMKAAKPRDFERQPDGSFRAVEPTKGPGATKGKPGRAPSTPTSLSFPADPGGSSSWGDTKASVQARTGKVYFKIGKSGYVCSGTVVGDSKNDGASVVLTAAHCAYDWRRGFATTWMFIPDFDAKPQLSTSNCSTGGTYGCWTAQALVVHRDFASAGRFNTQATNNDFAFAVVGTGGLAGESRDLDQVVGAYGLTETSELSAWSATAFGYPAGAPFGGEDLRYCAGSVFADPYSSGSTWGLPCDMTGGSSGGPWLDQFVAAGEAIGSLNSYGYSGYDYMFGPKFDGDTLDMLDAAKSSPSRNLVYPS